MMLSTNSAIRHLAYLTVPVIRLPVPLCPANGFPVLPGGAITRPFSISPLLLPRLLLALRHLGPLDL